MIAPPGALIHFFCFAINIVAPLELECILCRSFIGLGKPMLPTLKSLTRLYSIRSFMLIELGMKNKLQISLPALPFLQNQLTPIKAFLNSNWDEVLEVQGDLTKVKNELDLLVLPLSEVPIEKPEGVVITALLERAKAGESLLVKKEKWTDGKLLKLSDGASVAVKTEMQKAQLLHFRPDLNISFRKISDAAAEADAFIAPTAFAEYFDENLSRTGFGSHQSIPLQPEEFIPTPGAGVLALICKKENLPQRRLLKQIHHSKTAAATNIERAIQREKDYPVAVYCTRDQANHYHLWAASFREGQLYQFKISSGTSVGLVERVCAEI